MMENYTGEGFDKICPECYNVCEECDCENPAWMENYTA
jgi:hypothetical protein